MDSSSPYSSYLRSSTQPGQGGLLCCVCSPSPYVRLLRLKNVLLDMLLSPAAAHQIHLNITTRTISFLKNNKHQTYLHESLRSSHDITLKNISELQDNEDNWTESCCLILVPPNRSNLRLLKTRESLPVHKCTNSSLV